MRHKFTLYIFTVVISFVFLSVQSRAASRATEIFAASGLAIVSISARSTTGAQKGGSGVLVAPDEILTNCHVIEDALIIDLAFSDNKTVSASIAGRYEGLDLCLLRARSEGRKPPKIGSSSSVRPGQSVFAIGAPLGLEKSISDGIVSAIREHNNIRLIQNTAPISPGSSGGGLFDDRGSLIAITTSTYSAGQSINFAIPADYILSKPLIPMSSIPAVTSNISFKGLPFGTSQKDFQAAFPGIICKSSDAVTITCEGQTDFFGRNAEFTTFFGSKGMRMAYIRIYATDMDDAFTSAALSLADRFNWFYEATPGSKISWDVGGKKEQAVFLVKCDGKARCLDQDAPGIMVYMSDFRFTPPKRKDF